MKKITPADSELCKMRNIECMDAAEGFTELVTGFAKVMWFSGLGTIVRIITRSVKPCYAFLRITVKTGYDNRRKINP